MCWVTAAQQQKHLHFARRNAMQQTAQWALCGLCCVCQKTQSFQCTHCAMSQPSSCRGPGARSGGFSRNPPLNRRGGWCSRAASISAKQPATAPSTEPGYRRPQQQQLWLEGAKLCVRCCDRVLSRCVPCCSSLHAGNGTPTATQQTRKRQRTSSRRLHMHMKHCQTQKSEKSMTRCV